MKSKLGSFCKRRKSKNTQCKTKSDLNAWKKFCESLKESRAIENRPAKELDPFCPKLPFPLVNKMAPYEPCILSGFQQSFKCHLHEKGSLINILKDNEFSKSREVVAAKRKKLIRQGKRETVQMPQERELSEGRTRYAQFNTNARKRTNMYTSNCYMHPVLRVSLHLKL